MAYLENIEDCDGASSDYYCTNCGERYYINNKNIYFKGQSAYKECTKCGAIFTCYYKYKKKDILCGQQ